MSDDREKLLSLAGPVLARYLEDPSITNVFVNPGGTCFVDRFAQPREEVATMAPADLETFLAAVAHRVGQEWRETSPSLHAALRETGWRIQAAMFPHAPGLTMALRKHPTETFTLDQYVAQGIFTPAQDRVLREALASRKRILLSGATGSAKTSVLNACLHELRDTTERLCICEDDPEIVTEARNATFFRTRPGVSMTQLVFDALRYQPDRIIIGEVRDGAALAMCRAFQTGHAGMSSMHAESAEATLSMLEQRILEASATPQEVLIGSTIDLIVHMERTPDGTLRCDETLAVRGYAHGAYITETLAFDVLPRLKSRDSSESVSSSSPRR